MIKYYIFNYHTPKNHNRHQIIPVKKETKQKKQSTIRYKPILTNY